MKSAPSGTGAPVNIRTACPAPTRPSKRAPAADMPITSSRRPGAESAARIA